MSTLLLGQCWPIQIDPTAKAVLVSLADQASDDGDCYPAVGTIAARTCLSERTVQSAIRRLCELGLLTMRQQASGKRTNAYTLTPDAWQGPRFVPRAQQLAAERLERARRAQEAQEVAAGTAGTPQQLHPAGAAPCRSCTRTGAAAAPESSMNINTNTPLPPAGQGEQQAGQEPGSSGPAPELTRQPAVRKKRAGAAESLADYLARCEAEGRDAIPPDDPIFVYAARVGIGADVLALHWREFRRRRLSTGKGQRDWPQAFGNSVRDNWYRLWFLRPGEPARLTTAGEQARRELQAERGLPSDGGDHGGE